MSINNPQESEVGADVCVPKYEEFEDILEYDNSGVASTDALLPDHKMKMKEFLRSTSIRNDIAKVEKLGIEEVRWFYQTGKKKKWKPFIGNDSISIESEWRSVSRSDREIRRVSVRGDMYEVDVLERKCYPVYWSSFNLTAVEDSVDIIRGTWFYEGNFMPLNEELADRIETEHIERWKGFCLDDIKTLIVNMAMHSVKLSNCHVDWYTVNDVYMHSDAVSYRALRNIVQKFGASKTSTSGNKLHRGYREDAMPEDCMPPVDHLVFVVHGIGAKTDRHKIVRNTSEFRTTCNRVAAKQYAHFTGRVEFLPVEWRSKLILDNGIVDTFTPKRSLGLRQFLNNNVMDILYYTSPLYRGELVTALRNEIKRLHGMFMKRNSNFQGKISIFAHSLGTVIVHDIMTGWSPESLFEEYLKKEHENALRIIENADNEDSSKFRVQSEKLESELTEINFARAKIAHIESGVLLQNKTQKRLGFAVENFFCVGSPLAVFLSLRGQRPSDGLGTQNDILPRTACRRIFNIYHPADPIAYRFEPLILSHYSSIAPLQVHWHSVIHKTLYEEMPVKPYTTETTKEMGNMSTREPSIDATSMDISDAEGSVEQDSNFVDGEYTETQNNINELSTTNPGDSSETSPQIDRRPSYLKTLSGSALKVGKAIWVKARGSTSTNSKGDDAVSLDASLVSEENAPAINDIEQQNDDKEPSISSGESCSPSPVMNRREMRRANSIGSGGLPKSKVIESEMSYDTDNTFNPASLEFRLDYELQEGFTESRLGYAPITSHTSYWGSQDVALFVLMQIHPPSALS